MLGTIFFDEAHHIGAPTYLDAIQTLREQSQAVLVGATATPVHSSENIQKIFEGKSFWAYLDDLETAPTLGGIDREVKDVVIQLDNAIQAGELTPLDYFYSINPNSLRTNGAKFWVRTDPLNPKSQFCINPDLHAEVLRRITPPD